MSATCTQVPKEEAAKSEANPQPDPSISNSHIFANYLKKNMIFEQIFYTIDDDSFFATYTNQKGVRFTTRMTTKHLLNQRPFRDTAKEVAALRKMARYKPSSINTIQIHLQN